MPPKKAGTKRKRGKQSTAKPAAKTTFDTTFYSDNSSSDESDGGDRLTKRGELRRRRGHKPKRPKTVAPQAPDLSDQDEPLDREINSEGHAVTTKSVTVQVVNGLDGPELKMNLADILVNGQITLNGVIYTIGKGLVAGSQESSTKVARPASFCDLPTELSLNIYRRLFVTQDMPIVFTSRRGFARSGQFLSVCRKVHDEGSLILYGENSFHFSRANQTRGKYYEAIWKDIGFGDVRRFLHDIGTHNVEKLRYISITFEDTLPSMAPKLDYEERKYFNDPVLIEVITMLAKNQDLEKFRVAYWGKCRLTASAYHFLKALCDIRCKEYRSDTYNLRPSKIAPGIAAEVAKLVVKSQEVNNMVDESKKKFVPEMYLR